MTLSYIHYEILNIEYMTTFVVEWLIHWFSRSSLRSIPGRVKIEKTTTCLLVSGLCGTDLNDILIMLIALKSWQKKSAVPNVLVE